MAPIVLEPKPDGTVRFCANYRELNQILRHNCYPLPRTDETFEGMGMAKFISKLDLTQVSDKNMP